MTIADTYMEGVAKVATGKITIAAMRKVIADPQIKLPVGFYKECRSKGIRLHVRRGTEYSEQERMYQ
jgi:hypothetical protein